MNYTELDPGIKDAVKLLRQAGFKTTDSGDGISKGNNILDAQAAGVQS